MKKCLLIIDVQNDYFEGGKNPLKNAEGIAENIKKVLKYFRNIGDYVIHIQHISVRNDVNFFIKGTKGCEIHNLVEPNSTEKLIIKNYPNSFKDTELLPELKNKGIQELFICGMMTHMCVATTIKAAFDFGFHCKLIKDCCTTKELRFEDTIISAELAHKTILASLNGIFCDVIGLQDLGNEN